MKTIKQGYYSGERALFHEHDLILQDTTFADGESPLKESENITLDQCIFKWKYPLWYSKNIHAQDTTLLETARSGIWYTKDITMKDCVIEAPKTFRRAQHIHLDHVHMPNALETLWNCEDITMNHVQGKGDYFGMNSKHIKANHFSLSGNYAFDGASHIELHHATLLSKDAFWNCEDVVVYDSLIIGEYLGWNSKNITFINCTIDSLQGLCYMENLKMVNCKLLNTTLAFEYSSIDAQIISSIDSVKNPSSGNIQALEIKELIMEETRICPQNTTITTQI